MEAMRDLLRGNLARSLRPLREEDRLAAAWSVACGRAMAERGTVVGYEAGVVRIEVEDTVWLQQMLSLRSVLERELARIAGLAVKAIEFELKQTGRSKGLSRVPPDQHGSKTGTAKAGSKATKG